jgi:RNA polymerase sigma-70 factor (ECF subfamily)
MDNLTDQQIVEQVLSGNKESFGIFLDRYGNLVYRLAVSILKDCDAAEDAAQEAFMIAYQNLDTIRNPAAFGAWIAAITRNYCLKLIKRHTEVYLADMNQEPAVDETKDILNQEQSALLRKIIEKLPAKYKEIIDLRYFEGFSYIHLSSFLGISMDAVKSRLYHAKKEILNILQKEGLI